MLKLNCCARVGVLAFSGVGLTTAMRTLEGNRSLLTFRLGGLTEDSTPDAIKAVLVRNRSAHLARARRAYAIEADAEDAASDIDADTE